MYVLHQNKNQCTTVKQEPKQTQDSSKDVTCANSNPDQTNQYRRSPSGSDGIHVFLSACLRPVDPNPVWIPTNPITLCLLPSPPPAPFLFPATSQTTRTVFGGAFVKQLRPVNRRAGNRIAASPNVNPAIPIAREVKTIRAVDRRVASEGRAWNSLRGDCIVVCNAATPSLKAPRVSPIRWIQMY